MKATCKPPVQEKCTKWCEYREGPPRCLGAGLWDARSTWKSRNWLPNRSQPLLRGAQGRTKRRGIQVAAWELLIRPKDKFSQSSQRSCGVSLHADIQHMTGQRPEQPNLTSGWDLMSQLALLSVGSQPKWALEVSSNLKSTYFISMVYWGEHSASFLPGKNIQFPHFAKSSLSSQAHWY